MVLASKAGPDPAAEALRRLGVLRVATKYPRIAARHLEETGRQGEIVEVKGSVELAPLTGMVEAIVDLTATGSTLRENNLVVREEIAACTARLIANPVAHKLKAARIDELLQRLRSLPAAGVRDERTIALAQGQRIRLREVPVASAAVYVPGGRAPYPSTVVMGVVTARAAGVLDVAVCAPPGADGEIHSAILGTCRLCG